MKTGDRGNYYVVAVTPPTEMTGKRLDRVFLEFVVDVGAIVSDEAMACIVGAFPLTKQFTGAELSYDADVPSVRLVPTGRARRVIMDITEVVKAWTASPTNNYGLVLGALTGPKVDGLTLQDGVLGPGASVRVSFFYENQRDAMLGAR